MTSASSLSQQTVGYPFARSAIPVELHAVPLVEVDAQLFQMIGADVAVNNRLAFRSRACDKALLPLFARQLEQFLPDLFRFPRRGSVRLVIHRGKKRRQKKDN